MKKTIILLLVFALALSPALATAAPHNDHNNDRHNNHDNDRGRHHDFDREGFKKVHHHNIKVYHGYPSAVDKLSAIEDKILKTQDKIDIIVKLYGDDPAKYPYAVASRYYDLLGQLDRLIERYDDLINYNERYGIIGYRYLV